MRALSTLGGCAIAGVSSGELKSGVDAFAAGALLVMLVGSRIPEAKSKAKAGNTAGLATVIGFAVAAALSNLT